MNASTFFTEDMFNRLKKDVIAKKVFRITETPYRKKIKTNGNTYELSISASHYVFGDREYFVSGNISHSYTNENGYRDIGGGNYLTVNLENYYAFKTGINKTLQRFPDYTPEEYYPEQLSLF